MGAITKRHQGIRHLRKDITHIQLTMDYDQECRDIITGYVNQLPDNMRSNFELLMTKKDLKDVLKVQTHINMANDVIDLVLSAINQYRRNRPVIEMCQSCKNDICRCPKRYLINEKMTK